MGHASQLFTVKTANGSIVCSNGIVYKPIFVGPGGYAARTWRTRQGAEKYAAQIGGSVEAIDGNNQS